ncbi:MAG: hypothetical protein ACETWK_01530 [Candidatus Aminicenantaceae bacterium]
MFCSVYKWLISQSLDSGKPFSVPVRRHLRHCTSCQEFAQFSESLEHRCVQDIQDFLKDYNEALKGKIISVLDTTPEPRKVPARKPILVPVLASVIVLLIVAISIIFLTVSTSKNVAPLNYLSELDITQTSLEDAVVKIESPYQGEILELRKSINSTTDYIRSCLDFKIGEEAD